MKEIDELQDIFLLTLETGRIRWRDLVARVSTVSAEPLSSNTSTDAVNRTYQSSQPS